MPEGGSGPRACLLPVKFHTHLRGRVVTLHDADGGVMTKLNQLIAVNKGVKSAALQTLTEAHRTMSKSALLSGISRTYQPRDEEGDHLPGESQRVVASCHDTIRLIRKSLTRMLDMQFTLDTANTLAKADVVVDGVALVRDAPVSYLLFLEKWLTDLHTFVAKLPTLDPAVEWMFSPSANAFASEPVETTRTAKIPRNHVLSPATDKHPAQVQLYYEDVIVGTWTTIRFSGAMPLTVVRATLDKLVKLREAVKFAREQANAAEVTDRQAGEAVLDYLFG